MSKTVPALVLSAFEDASSGDRFAEGDTVPLERGVFDNYEAAGLVRKAGAAVEIDLDALKQVPWGTATDCKVSSRDAPPAKPKTPAKRPRAAK